MNQRSTRRIDCAAAQGSNAKSKIVNAISIDVEDYFQVTGFESKVNRTEWDNFPSRVVQNTRSVIALLKQFDIKATFFVVGWIAKKFPFLVKEIDAGGHEIGSHSNWHRLVYDLSPDEFRDDLRRSMDLLQDIIGRPVESFRAPTFSITEKSLWALEIMAEEGIRFDSSIFPTRHDRYGIPNAVRSIHPIETKSGIVWEFPLPVSKVLGVTVPAGGGGYFRLYPYFLSHKLISKINLTGQPVMFYFHPWEIDPNQPEVAGVRYSARKRHRNNLASTEKKLTRLLQDFRFSTMQDVIESYSVRGSSPPVPVSRYEPVTAGN